MLRAGSQEQLASECLIAEECTTVAKALVATPHPGLVARESCREYNASLSTAQIERRGEGHKPRPWHRTGYLDDCEAQAGSRKAREPMRSPREPPKLGLQPTWLDAVRLPASEALRADALVRTLSDTTQWEVNRRRVPSPLRHGRRA